MGEAEIIMDPNATDADAIGEEKCDHCGGSEFVRAVRLKQPHEVGDIGLRFRRAWILVGTETLYADLCKACGTVARFYVKTTDRDWITG